VNAIPDIKTKKGARPGFLLSLAFCLVTATNASAATLPQDGLVLHLETDSGVTVADGTTDVTGWTDQSPSANDLVAISAPQLVAADPALNGQDTISFDGIDDTLERLTDVNGLPAGDADRTMFTVVKYDSLGYGGVAYGTQGVNNQVFGLIVAPNGNLMVQGWGVTNDFNSGVAGTNMGWMTQAARHSAGTMTHYQNGTQIDLRVHTYATTVTRIVAGAEIDRLPFLNMDLAAIIIYDRALSDAEMADVQAYLGVKYFGGVDIAIQSPAEGDTVTSGDVDVTYAADGTAYDHVHLSLDGGAAVELTEAAGTHTFNGVAEGNHTVVATLVDAAHAQVGVSRSSATVNFAAADCFPDNFAPNCTVDTDGDGTPDSVETEAADTDGDGMPDYLESSIDDADADGTPNELDPDDADICVPSTFTAGCTVDTDGDGVADSIEGETADTDGDGVPDWQESSTNDADADGTPDQADRSNTNPCVPNNTGPRCVPPKSGGGSFSLTWLFVLAGILASRRRRYLRLAA